MEYPLPTTLASKKPKRRGQNQAATTYNNNRDGGETIEASADTNVESADPILPLSREELESEVARSKTHNYFLQTFMCLQLFTVF